MGTSLTGATTKRLRRWSLHTTLKLHCKQWMSSSFQGLFSQAIINIQDLAIVTTITSFSWREKENCRCGLPSWKSWKQSNPKRYSPKHGRKGWLISVCLWQTELVLSKEPCYNHPLHPPLTPSRLVDMPGRSTRSSQYVHISPAMAESLQKGPIFLLACPHGKASCLHFLCLHKGTHRCTHIALN